MSLNQIIARAIAEKLSALMTEDYLEERAARGSRERFEAVLGKAPNVDADERARKDLTPEEIQQQYPNDIPRGLRCRGCSR